MLNDILVGGAITILKNMKVKGKDDIPYNVNPGLINPDLLIGGVLLQ